MRRLTPLECERLQGFPDGWTDIGPWEKVNKKVARPLPRWNKIPAAPIESGFAGIFHWLWLLQKIVFSDTIGLDDNYPVHPLSLPSSS